MARANSAPSFQALCNALGYSFNDVALLEQALTHRSHSADHNERLEFLGDSVLNAGASMLLYQRNRAMDEGQLSRVRSHLVRQECLVQLARKFDLPATIRVGAGERKNGKSSEGIKESILADCMEAIYGAVLLDSHFDEAIRLVISHLEPILLASPEISLGKDPKTRLQEWLQSKKLSLPVYRVVVEGGTSASPEFEVTCTVGEPYSGVWSGRGASKRHAEQQAAEQALSVLDKLPDAGA